MCRVYCTHCLERLSKDCMESSSNRRRSTIRVVERCNTTCIATISLDATQHTLASHKLSATIPTPNHHQNAHIVMLSLCTHYCHSISVHRMNTFIDDLLARVQTELARRRLARDFTKVQGKRGLELFNLGAVFHPRLERERVGALDCPRAARRWPAARPCATRSRP